MAHPAGCLFDLDGLLLDTEPLHAQAWQQAARHFGRALSEGELMQLRGRRRLDCADQVRQWISASGLDVPSTEALLAIRQPIAEALLIQAQPMAGAQALVQRCLDLGLPMALATSSSGDAVKLKAKPHPWLEAIQERVHGDDPELKRGKPHPDVFQLAAQRLGVSCEESWAFEDSPAGAQAALAAGCRVFVVPAPGADRNLYPNKVTDFLDSLQDVLALLNEGTQ
ncbi:HAD family phosphatase [Synechococcus sp. A10-1-5-1]|uniref:HAD family hydrolase n=1 Tax=Synechococcus sp. A10-1-5-1 TaxID=2936507 RepID=UPI00200071B6|nr:HAD family phosphatase [Synechococcus sp. A10-1-5-1]UPM50405.1 HAD family phosphatase [Synechococcus sp. A10-1-5-1]